MVDSYQKRKVSFKQIPVEIVVAYIEEKMKSDGLGLVC